VKHCRELYKAEGISNAAEPGNQTHARFYVSTLVTIAYVRYRFFWGRGSVLKCKLMSTVSFSIICSRLSLGQ
jgi:hypothetical protein